MEMTRKELQDWLDQFPPDAEIWKNSDGCHDPIDSDHIELTYSNEGEISVWYSSDETYCLVCDSDTIERSKVKRIIF